MPKSKQTHIRSHSPKKSTPPVHPSHPPRQKPSAHHPPTASTAAEPGDDAPCWLPRGDAWRSLPEPIRRAVHQRILPMCKALLEGAPDHLERSAAATLVYLTWLEIRGQIELEQARALSDPLVPALADTDQLLARHLRLLKAKHRNSELLAKLRLARENSARRQSPAANHAPSAFFDNPLGPLRCVPSVPSDAARESRPSRVERPVPEDPEEQNRPTQLPQREVQGDPTAQSDPQRDKTDPPNVSLKNSRVFARRQTARADARIRRLDAQVESRKSRLGEKLPSPRPAAGPFLPFGATPRLTDRAASAIMLVYSERLNSIALWQFAPSPRPPAGSPPAGAGLAHARALCCSWLRTRYSPLPAPISKH